MVDKNGKALIHDDFELAKAGATLLTDPFVMEAAYTNEHAIARRYRDADGKEFFGAATWLTAVPATVITTIPASTVFEGINTTTRRNVYLTFAVWFIAVLFSWFFAKTITQPLVELRDAVAAIEDGHYHVDLYNKNQDETGVLTASVRDMSHVLENFEKFTNKMIARLARKGKLVTGGVDKEATFFFSDIRGFTAISEKMTPSEVVDFLNDYMERMVACVLITGGAIDKFIGDAVMAHWGAVESTGTSRSDALAAIRAALMMRASLFAFNSTRGDEKHPIIKIGCGLNSGTVVAGQIGSEEHLEFTVIGDAVSFADRTETFNKAFGTEILISEDTWQLVGDNLITEEMPPVTVKGAQVRIFAVVNIKNPVLTEKVLYDLDKIPKTDRAISRQCVGPEGPQTLADLRKLLGIATPDLSKVNTDEEEKKYKVQST
jgi:adenylate cyclase